MIFRNDEHYRIFRLEIENKTQKMKFEYSEKERESSAESDYGIQFVALDSACQFNLFLFQMNFYIFFYRTCQFIRYRLVRLLTNYDHSCFS